MATTVSTGATSMSVVVVDVSTTSAVGVCRRTSEPESRLITHNKTSASTNPIATPPATRWRAVNALIPEAYPPTSTRGDAVPEYRWISRSEWGANPPTVEVGHAVPLEQIVGLVVHHTVIVMPDYDHDGLVGGDIDDICSYMRQLQRARPDLGLEVPYSTVHFEGATPDEVIVAEGRGFGRTGAHTIGLNSTRYGCALAGDYTARQPTPGQLAGIRWVGTQLADPAGAVATIGHRYVYATACPGVDAYPHISELHPPFVTAPTAPIEEDDMLPAPAVIQLPDGTVAVIFRGADHLTYYWQTPPGDAYPIPDSAWASGPAATVTAAEVILAGVGADGQPYEQRLDLPSGKWAKPVPLGGKAG